MTDINGWGLVDEPTEPRFLVIGQIRKPHGVRGEVRVVPHTDQPERFGWLEEVYLGDSLLAPVAVEGVRYHQDLVLLKLAGFDNREDAMDLRGLLVQIPETAAIPLEEGEYFLYRLEGLAVYTDAGEHLGALTQVIETNANNVFVVRSDGSEILLPDIPDVILAIDFENGRMLVHLLPGLRP